MLGPKAYGFPVEGRLKATSRTQATLATTSNENEHWFLYKLPPESMRAGTRACFYYSVLVYLLCRLRCMRCMPNHADPLHNVPYF